MSVNCLSPAEEVASHGLLPEAGQLTAEFVSKLRQGYQMIGADRACHNAVTNNAIESLALNRAAVRMDDGHFTHRIKSKGVTNQQKSGRCWMFAALNTLRPLVMGRTGVAEFEFSTAFLQFWDRLERANLFFESVIEMRGNDFLDRQWEMMTRWTLGDGGWWNFVVALIRKYGVVPVSVMPETHSSSNTALLNHVLGRLVRSRSARMLDAHEKGLGECGLRAMKEEAMREVYRFLVISLGEPPVEFDWRFKRAGKDEDAGAEAVEDPHLSASEKFTPKSFFDRFVGSALEDFVCLYNDPKNDLDRHYRFAAARNMVGQACMNFVNVDMAAMKQVAIASIRSNEALWFAVNMSWDQSTGLGLMHDRLFDYDSLFGLDLSLTKADRARFHDSASNHAMALMGVDLDDQGQPRKWLVENSWGDEKGADGWWTLHDSWFDEHVYTVIVHKRHVPDAILRHFENKPIELPAWYPGAVGVN